jgi:hypothetical protein
MRIFLPLLIFFLAMPALAKDVYKWTNEEGVVIYSETYREGAERMHVSGDKSSPRSGTEAADEFQEEAVEGAVGDSDYTKLEIVQPENEATVRNNEGTVTVGLVISPTLAEGDSIKIVVDGSELENDLKSAQFSLNNLNRGTHSLVVRVVDKDGNVQITSNSVNFHLRKASVITP